jgi:hypothetical protein
LKKKYNLPISGSAGKTIAKSPTKKAGDEIVIPKTPSKVTKAKATPKKSVGTPKTAKGKKVVKKEATPIKDEEQEDEEDTDADAVYDLAVKSPNNDEADVKEEFGDASEEASEEV